MNLTLDFASALSRVDLLAESTAAMLATWSGTHDATNFTVAEIDPALADTTALCDAYGQSLEDSANCVIVAGRRGGDMRYCACVILATTRADVNNRVRKYLDCRKASFASMDDAVSKTGMEYGGITPFGLPSDWTVLVDTAVVARPVVIVGSGVRTSKLFVPGEAVGEIPGAVVMPIAITE